MNINSIGLILAVISSFWMGYFFGILESFSILFFVMGMILYFTKSEKHEVNKK